MKGDKTVEARAVTVALTQANQSAIGSGVRVGEIVVTDGQDKLKNGASVEIREPDGTSKASQSTAPPASAAPTS